MKNIEEKIKNTINSFYEECMTSKVEKERYECGYKVRNGWIMSLVFRRARIAVYLTHSWADSFKVGVVPPPCNSTAPAQNDWRNIDDIVRDVNDITERRGHDAMWGASQFALRMMPSFSVKNLNFKAPTEDIDERFLDCMHP